jgi:hypothetical protein
MELSSDTLRRASVAVSSTLRQEELDEILAMDWWFDQDMAPPKKTPSPPQFVERDEVHRIVSGEV